MADSVGVGGFAVTVVIPAENLVNTEGTTLQNTDGTNLENTGQ